MSSENPSIDAEILLSRYKRKAGIILEILRNERGKELDVEDFIQTIQILIPILNRISKEIHHAKKELVNQIVVRLHSCLEDYEAQVVKMTKTGSIKRILTTRSLRKNLERHNAKVAMNLDFFVDQVVKLENAASLTSGKTQPLQPRKQEQIVANIRLPEPSEGAYGTIGSSLSLNNTNNNNTTSSNNLPSANTGNSNTTNPSSKSNTSKPTEKKSGFLGSNPQFGVQLQKELEKLEQQMTPPTKRAIKSSTDSTLDDPNEDFQKKMEDFEKQLNSVKAPLSVHSPLIFSEKRAKETTEASNLDNQDLDYGPLQTLQKLLVQEKDQTVDDDYGGLPIGTKLAESSDVDKPISQSPSKSDMMPADSRKSAAIKESIYHSISTLMSFDQDKRASATTPRTATSPQIVNADKVDHWKKNFGSTATIAKWTDLINVFRNNNINISENRETVLKYLLDSSNTGLVSKYKFTEFLKGFGPLKDCFDHINEVFREPFFFGYMSSKESESLLITQQPGTFLLRLSRSSPGCFALAVVSKPHQIVHILLNHNEMGQFSVVDETQLNGQRFFKSLKETLTFYASSLSIPYVSTVPLQPWFAGDLTSEEAEEFLRDQPIGTYMLRFSSQVGYFAASYKESTTTSKHVLISYNYNPKSNEETCAVYGEKELFKGLGALIKYHQAVLRLPFRLEEYTIGKAKDLLNLAHGMRPESVTQAIRSGIGKEEPQKYVFKIPLDSHTPDNPRYMFLTSSHIVFSAHEFNLALTWIEDYNEIPTAAAMRLISPEKKCTVTAATREGRNQMIQAVQNRISEILQEKGWNRPNPPNQPNSLRFGKYSFANGQEYEGEWVQSKFSGEGVHKLVNGTIYEGSFLTNLRHGNGILLEPSGAKFEGEWKEGVKSGWGIQTFPPNSPQISYQGQWHQDQRSGWGTVVYSNKVAVFCEWENDIPQTVDRMVCLSFPDGKTFTGFTVHVASSPHGVVRSGFGVSAGTNGDRHFGIWLNDKMNGSGYYQTSEFDYKGEFSDGKVSGTGVLTMGTSFVQGTFSGDVESGQLDIKNGTWSKISAQKGQGKRRPSATRGVRWTPFVEWRKWKDVKKNEVAKAFDESLNLSGNEQEKTKVVLGTLRCSAHPLGQMINTFVAFINTHYSPGRVPKQNPTTLMVVEDVYSFINAFSEGMNKVYKLVEVDVIKSSLREVIFPRISQTVNQVMSQNMKTQITKLEKKFTELQNRDVEAIYGLMGVEKKFYTPNPTETFANAIQLLQSIQSKTQLRTPSDRVNLLLQTTQSIQSKLEELSKNNSVIGADQLLPCICLVTYLSNVPELPVHVEFISNFLEESLEADVQGYILTQFHVALSYLENLQLTPHNNN